jgi:uncharacterized protein
MNRPIHFEILADDPQKLTQFYRTVFDWEIETWAGEEAYWLIKTGPNDMPGINGAIMHRHFPQGVINTSEVESLEEAVRKVESAGGRKLQGPNLIPGVGTSAYCIDPEGNVFGIIEPAPPAK